jgi:6-phosphofructokinase 1
MKIPVLGEARFPSPHSAPVSDDLRVPLKIVQSAGEPESCDVSFEVAGPRARLYFDAAQTRAGIVTCGGLCPGLNNVIRSAYHELHHFYGVKEIFGFRNGYQGLDPVQGAEPLKLDSEMVNDIHKHGGTILGTSRGPVDVGVAVENLMRRRINILFCIGGDGTQRGANDLYFAAKERGYPLSVVGVPKTIDNDVNYVTRTFGFLTALEESRDILDCAHTEAKSVLNGVSVVKLMGRHAGFIAAGATVASQDVNFTLIPEVPFKLDGEEGFLAALKRRVQARSHAIIVVAEGAGQDLLKQAGEERDASGNVKLADIGLFLRDRITAYFRAEKVPMTLRYFDPSYIIRSRPADSEDAILCDQYARHAVHAAMAGKTGLVIGILHDTFTHVPIEHLADAQKRVLPDGALWHAVLASTGQPARFG